MNIVKIVAITKPLVDGVETAEEFIAYAARVSNPTNQMNKKTAPNLLSYCIKNKHWSVFETVHITMEIITTRDIARQILRHRSFSFQEFSQRYADPTKDLGFTQREARLQDTKNRQNSIETDNEILKKIWLEKQDYVSIFAESAYKWAIENGIAKEQARSVLPEGLTISTMFMAGSLRSFIHWIQVRTDSSTQKEHRQVAESAKQEIIKYFPSLKKNL